MAFQMRDSKNGVSNLISYDSGHCSESQGFSYRIKEKGCVFFHYFLSVDEFVQCIKSHLEASCYGRTG